MTSKLIKERSHQAGYEDGIKGKRAGFSLLFSSDKQTEGQRQGYEDHLRNKDLAERITAKTGERSTERVVERVVVVKEVVRPISSGYDEGGIEDPFNVGLKTQEVSGVEWLKRIMARLEIVKPDWQFDDITSIGKYFHIFGIVLDQRRVFNDFIGFCGQFTQGQTKYWIKILFLDTSTPSGISIRVVEGNDCILAFEDASPETGRLGKKLVIAILCLIRPKEEKRWRSRGEENKRAAEQKQKQQARVNNFFGYPRRP